MRLNKEYMDDVLMSILSCDSPSGYTHHVMKRIEEIVTKDGYSFTYTKKGNGIIDIPGRNNDKTIALSAHVDTLGLMVRSIKSNGHLAFTTVGGPLLPSLDSEWCKVYTRDGKCYEGTIFIKSPAAHVYKDAKTLERNDENLEVVLDEVVKSKEDVEALGISNGDYICYDPKTKITSSGYVKSRFLDDKLSVAIILGVLHAMKEENILPEYHTKVMISTYEEVGHGCAWLPEDVEEMLAIDMGCVGLDLSCSEHDVSICAKDSTGPYDYELTSKLINLAKENQLSYAVDIYPMYGSDASAALRAGNDIRAALIGSGVFASHGYERTHYEGIENTMKLLYAYLQAK